MTAPERINWGLHQAVRAAQRSRHPQTQVGAVVLAPDGRWAEGCNDDDLHAEVACGLFLILGVLIGIGLHAAF